MALQKEIWLGTIVENLFPDNSFASKSVDDSGFVDNKKVHIPNAGKPSAVKTNRDKFPATVETRTDNDLEYEMDELTTDPIRIPNKESVELSYAKRSSVVYNDREELRKNAAINILRRWAKTVPAASRVMTSGLAEVSHLTGTTGKRLAVVKADINKLMNLFNSHDIPQDGRYLLLDATMYGQLFSSLTEAERNAFLACADASKGILGNYAGFNIMMRSTVLPLKADFSINAGEAAATDIAAGFAWQESCVSRAIGDTKMFGKEDDPTYYGDIYSFLVRCGGSARRYDNKGIALLCQTTAVQEPTE